MLDGVEHWRRGPSSHPRPEHAHHLGGGGRAIEERVRASWTAVAIVGDPEDGDTARPLAATKPCRGPRLMAFELAVLAGNFWRYISS